ncbi:MAG: DNA-binding response regulator, partial [Chitinophagaceae bacterium]|nr:DNA-binding response regulator [Chitinophagaceae bacterium]
MKVLIVEDEKVAAQQLKDFIQEYNNSIEILPL